MSDHEHEAVRWGERPFFGCVAPHECDARAHGGIVVREVCSCGAIRDTAQNRCFEEIGPRLPTERRFVGKKGTGRGYYVWVRADGTPYGAAHAVCVRPGCWVEGPSVSAATVPAAALVLL